MCSRLFRATPQQRDPAGRQLRKQANHQGDRHSQSQPTGSLQRYGNTATHPHILNQARTGIDADHDCHRNAFRLMMEPWQALLIRVDVLSPLSSHTTAKKSGWQTTRKQANPLRRQARSEPTGRTTPTLRKHRNAPPRVLIRHAQVSGTHKSEEAHVMARLVFDADGPN